MSAKRFFWWDARELTFPWKPVYLGREEHCNRTIGLRTPSGVLFVCLNVPLRQQMCDECRRLL